MISQVDIGEAPRSLGQRVLAGAGEIAPLLLLGIISFIALFGLYSHAVTKFEGKTVFERVMVAAVLCCVCLLPPLLLLILALVLRRSRASRLEFELTEPPAAEDGGPATLEMRTAFENASRLWTHEILQLGIVTQRVVTHATLYGVLCMLTLATCIIFSFESLASRTLAPLTPYRVYLGYAVGTAVLLMFARDYGRMIVRVANRDGTAAMFAAAARRLLVVVAGTGAFIAMAIAGFSFQQEPIEAGYGWVLLGVATGLLGDRAFEAVSDRVAGAVGVAVPRRTPGNELQRVDGLSDDDATRLAEEGIDSLHALAYYSTPKLFFHARFTLQRICDWQEQALLQVWVGETRARGLREQFGVRGSSDLIHVARSVFAQSIDPKELDALAGILGLRADLRGVLGRFLHDHVAHRLAIFRTAVPRKGR